MGAACRNQLKYVELRESCGLYSAVLSAGQRNR